MNLKELKLITQIGRYQLQCIGANISQIPTAYIILV